MTEDYTGTPEPLSQLMSQLMNEKFNGISKNQQVLSIWMKINGERERLRTVAVYLDEKDTHTLPRLVVYVDSNACVVDFNASRELYLARLEGAGLKLASVDFRLSRHAKEHRERMEKQGKTQVEELPDLTDEERKHIEKLVKDLPPKLQASVSKAISSSMRRQRAESTQKS